MSDFAQTGLISTLQRLNDSHLPQIEAELTELSAERPVALVLPCHGRDLDRPALTHIVEEIRGATWLREVVMSMNGLDDESFERAGRIVANMEKPVRVLWNDRLPGLGPAGEAGQSGKGANVFHACQLLAGEGNCFVIATQDCDVASFRRADLARLCFAVAHPDLGYRFAKMYYSRVTDRMYGRVSRLFLTPLLHAVVRVAGHQPLIDFLLSFRYPLAGEIAVQRELAAELPLATGWNLELSHLCETFRRIDPREVCQVDGGSGYDHKHQPAATALADMAEEIASELLSQLALEGLPVDGGFRSAISRAYRREAAHALRRSTSLAQINAIPFDRDREHEIVEIFAEKLAGAIRLKESQPN